MANLIMEEAIPRLEQHLKQQTLVALFLLLKDKNADAKQISSGLTQVRVLLDGLEAKLLAHLDGAGSFKELATRMDAFSFMQKPSKKKEPVVLIATTVDTLKKLDNIAIIRRSSGIPLRKNAQGNLEHPSTGILYRYREDLPPNPPVSPDNLYAFGIQEEIKVLPLPPEKITICKDNKHQYVVDPNHTCKDIQ